MSRATVEGRRGAFLRFGQLMHRSRDLDPVYDVLRTAYRDAALDPESAHWLTFLYVQFYHLPSAIIAWQHHPEPGEVPCEACQLQPYGSERRHARRGKLLTRACLGYATALALAGGFHRWLHSEAVGVRTPTERFRVIYRALRGLYSIGNWAAFKWMDLLIHVHGLNAEFPSMLPEPGSYPVQGLALVTGVDPRAPVRHLLGAADELQTWVSAQGETWTWDELETVCCNFKGLHGGKYYVGNDIDEMLERFLEAEPIIRPGEPHWGARLREEGRFRLWWRARAAALPAAYLGEARGWHGIELLRRRVYVDTGAVLARDEVPA